MEPRTTDDGDWPPTELAIERELATIRGAIEMVAGGSPRASSSAGCGSPRRSSPRPAAFAAEAGVRVVPLWMADDAGADLAIERIDG